jgi:hypothetical protein
MERAGSTVRVTKIAEETNVAGRNTNVTEATAALSGFRQQDMEQSITPAMP